MDTTVVRRVPEGADHRAGSALPEGLPPSG